MSTHGKLNLLLRRSINLDFSSPEMQRKLIQTKLYYMFFALSEKKHLRNQVYVIGTACFDECFLFHIIIGTHYFS